MKEGLTVVVLVGAWVQVEGEGEGMRGGAGRMSSRSPPLYRVQCCCQTLPVAQCFPAIAFILVDEKYYSLILYNKQQT